MECVAAIALPTGGPAIRLKNKKLMRPRRPKQYCLQLDIALWCKNQIEHSIWDESLLFSNCARSLEYSSSSTLAGLSYHICGKLEVAFKGSPSSQHQHCTDEAQKAETVLSVVIYIYIKFDFETTIKVDFHCHVNFMLVTHMCLTGFICVNKIQDNTQDPRFK